MRKALSLTQSDLAALTGVAGVDGTAISRIETGKREPSLELGLALCRVLGVTPDVLFTAPETSEEKAAA